MSGLRKLGLGAVALTAASSGALAVGEGTFTVGTEIPPGNVITTIATAGAAALLLAFGAGAGFRIAKKAYGWILGKI